jgi:hypothetical protein
LEECARLISVFKKFMNKRFSLMKKDATATRRANYFRRINKTHELDVKKKPIIPDVDPADAVRVGKTVPEMVCSGMTLVASDG